MGDEISFEDMLKRLKVPRKRTDYNKFQGYCISRTISEHDDEVSASDAMSACAYAWRNKDKTKDIIELVDEYLKGEKRFE